MAKKVYVDFQRCNACRQCIPVCPVQAIQVKGKAIICKHCDPNTAPCAKACPEGAIVAVGDGDILTVVPEKCTGCGECVKACPYDAIFVLGDVARKCNMCWGYNGGYFCKEKCDSIGINAIGLLEEKTAGNIVDTGTWCLKIIPDTDINPLERIIIDEEGTPKDFGVIGYTKGEKKPVYYINIVPDMNDVERAVIQRAIKRFIESGSLKTDTHEQMKGFIMEVARYMGASIDASKLDPLATVATLNSTGFGPFDLLLKDDKLEEIMGIGVGENKPIYVYHRKYGMLRTNIFFKDDTVGQTEVRSIIERMVRSQPGAKIDDLHPRVNTRLPDGSRLHACIYPMTLSGSLITIRKFRENPLTPLEIINFGTATVEVMSYMWTALENEISLLIGGNTGSGKTTSLNAISTFIPHDERIIILESTPEINLPHLHQARVITVPQASIGMEDILEDTLRMRPDRVIVGEVRSGEEARAFINSVLAGQARGCMATFHALDAISAAKRLKNPPMNIAPMDIQTLDIILIQRRMSFYDTKTKTRMQLRRILEIVEIDKEKPAETDIPELIPVYKYNTKTRSLVRVYNGLTPLEKRISEYNYGMTEREFLREREMRQRFLEALLYKHQQLPDGINLNTFMEYIRRFTEDSKFRENYEATGVIE